MGEFSDETLLRAINEAIWLRDNASRLDRKKLIEVISQIGNYKVFSARQIGQIIANRLSRPTISRALGKHNNKGGSLNPIFLDDIKQSLLIKINGSINSQIIKGIIDNGTSQSMLSRLTGITQSEISRKLSGK